MKFSNYNAVNIFSITEKQPGTKRKVYTGNVIQAPKKNVNTYACSLTAHGHCYFYKCLYCMQQEFSLLRSHTALNSCSHFLTYTHNT